MIDLWCKLIISKRRLFTDCPSNLQDAVKARLKELGYDTDGNPLSE